MDFIVQTVANWIYSIGDVVAENRRWEAVCLTL